MATTLRPLGIAAGPTPAGWPHRLTLLPLDASSLLPVAPQSLPPLAAVPVALAAPPRTPHAPHGTGPLALAAFAMLLGALIASVLLVLAPAPPPFLSFTNGTFGSSSRADFDTNPARRFAPQRPVTRVTQPQK